MQILFLVIASYCTQCETMDILNGSYSKTECIYSSRFQVIEEFIVAYQNVYWFSLHVLSSEITYNKNTDFCWTLVMVIVEGHLTWRSSCMSVLIVKPVRSPTSDLSSYNWDFVPQIIFGNLCCWFWETVGQKNLVENLPHLKIISLQNTFD